MHLFLSKQSPFEVLHRYLVGKEFLAFCLFYITFVTPLACLDATALKSNVLILFFKIFSPVRHKKQKIVAY